MPQIDVTDALFDPDFSEYLVVFRRVVTVGNNGLQTVTMTQIEPQPIGVIVPQDDAPVFRGPDQQNIPRLIKTYSTFMLRGPAKKNSLEPAATPPTTITYLPDLVFWAGDYYIVNKVVPFGRWGAGFVVADCSSIDSIDAPPTRWGDDDLDD